MPTEKFCGECGQSLSVAEGTYSVTLPRGLSFDVKLQKIQKYLPGGLTEKILSQRGKIEGEHRQVTVLFVDMENFTPLVEKLGAEEAYSIMDNVYEILIHKVHDFEGTVNEMTGDGLIALFGAPIALEDAPQRAIRSALAIHQEIARFSDRMKQEKNISPIKMRIGIHTGPVIVGTLGNDLRVEFKAVGDTVNLASRIQSLASAGTTCVSNNTFKLTEGLFRFESLGQKEIRGKEHPVHIYQVIASSSIRTRFDVNAERGLTAFVGRARELENLLDGLDRAKTGRGQVFSLIGEAGVGKSRLLYEFRKALTSEDVTFLEGKCLSYGRGSAYHPIIDILKATFNIQTVDLEASIREKLTDGLRTLNINVDSSLPFLLELLSVKDSGMDKISISPEGKKDRLIETIKQLIIKYSELQPLVIAIEDLHWVDMSTEDALQYLLEVIPGARILLIFTHRPDYAHIWDRKSYHNHLTLNRLSNRESLAMTCSLLETDQLDKNIEELILARTEGIPFFIEEHIKSLKDLKIIERQNGSYKLTKDVKTITIPSTIQDVIMVRVDALPEGAKEIIRISSVIEREFSHELLKRVASLQEQELLSGLSILKDSELIYERGIYPDLIYIFKHALTREVVYDSLLAKKKKTLHEQIGRAIEEMYQNNLEPCFGLLAAHFMEGEDFVKGAEYSKKAMRNAEKAASLNDAIAYARKRVACIEKLPQTEQMQRMRVDARTRLGLYIAQLNYAAEAKEVIDPVIEFTRASNDKKHLCKILMILGLYYHYVEENPAQSSSVFEESLDIADEIQDVVTLAIGNFFFGFPLAFDCQFERAVPKFQKAIDINAFVNNLWGVSAMTSNLAIFCHFYSGKINECMKAATEALSIAEKSADIFSKGMAYNSYGLANFAKGSLDQAEKNLMKGLQLCERINFPTWLCVAHMGLAETYFELGEFDKSNEHYSRYSEIFERNRLFPSHVCTGRIGAIKSQIMRGRGVDLKIFNELNSKIKLTCAKGWASKMISEGFSNVDNQHIADAESWIMKAIDADRTNGMNFYLGRDYIQYYNILKRNGDRVNAREKLGKAIAVFRECGADGWVEKYEKELSVL